MKLKRANKSGDITKLIEIIKRQPGKYPGFKTQNLGFIGEICDVVVTTLIQWQYLELS